MEDFVWQNKGAVKRMDLGLATQASVTSFNRAAEFAEDFCKLEGQVKEKQRNLNVQRKICAKEEAMAWRSGDGAARDEAKRRMHELELQHSAVQEPLNQVLAGYRHPAPPVNENTVWTFLAVLTLRLGFPRDLRVVLYGAYVRVQYASCCSSFPPVRRILEGGTWFAVPKAERVSLLCIDAMCGDWVSGWRGLVSKLQYESDLESHFKSIHGSVSWQDFASKHTTCAYSDPRNQERMSAAQNDTNRDTLDTPAAKEGALMLNKMDLGFKAGKAGNRWQPLTGQRSWDGWRLCEVLT